MAVAHTHDHFRHYGLFWTLAASMLLHTALLSVLPPFRFDVPIKRPPLTIELQQPEPPEIVKPPEPPKPEPRKPEPKPLPPKPRLAPPPPPLHEQKPVEPQAPASPVLPVEPSHVEAPPPPAVIAAAPKPETPPAFTAPPPPPEPPKPTGPSPEEIDAARKAYSNALGREIAKYKRYPRIAQMRGWEGSVRLLLEIDASGKITSIKVEEASDHDVFNNAALEMAQKMIQPPPIPEALRGHGFSVRVPITFHLE